MPILKNQEENPLKVRWVRSVSAECCQTCNGTVFPHDTVISTTQLEDDCLTTQTKVCRVRPGLEHAVIELEFAQRNCCLLANGTMLPDGATWIENSGRPAQMLECCEGQIIILTQTTEPPPPYGVDLVMKHQKYIALFVFRNTTDGWPV